VASFPNLICLRASNLRGFRAPETCGEILIYRFSCLTLSRFNLLGVVRYMFDGYVCPELGRNGLLDRLLLVDA
jgi:hypothetical protein